MKRRNAGTSSETVTEPKKVSDDELLNELHQFYVNQNSGLLHIGRSVGLLDLFAPRRKINIMLMGNHSSGKSSFINWYIGQNIQKTGVAIETQDFTLVTRGQKLVTLTGEGTIGLFPHMKPLKDINGVFPYLKTELVPSQNQRFDLVTFIDTPGLADGDLSYPYDIEEAILWLGDKVDLIFVFFDPIGQALCKRTLSLVESLTKRFSEKMKFFLSKADEAGSETDRVKVIVQITQELSKLPGLDQSGFEIKTIYIPDHENLRKKDVMCHNQITQVCKLIDDTIALTIQKNFEKTNNDLNQIESLVDSGLNQYSKASTHYWKNVRMLLLFSMIALQFPISSLLHYRGRFNGWIDSLNFNSSDSHWIIIECILRVYSFITYEVFKFQATLLPINAYSLAFVSFVVVLIPIVTLGRFMIPCFSTIDRSQANDLLHYKETLSSTRRKREVLFQTYLNQMLPSGDRN